MLSFNAGWFSMQLLWFLPTGMSGMNLIAFSTTGYHLLTNPIAVGE